ncbi:Uncharacterised protein [Capnocytophaga canimorsus]|nr:Uncharacterised protein [Capnocytophaga canimorsus]
MFLLKCSYVFFVINIKILPSLPKSETFARTIHSLFFSYSDDFFIKSVSENSKLCSFLSFFLTFGVNFNQNLPFLSFFSLKGRKYFHVRTSLQIVESIIPRLGTLFWFLLVLTSSRNLERSKSKSSAFAHLL